MNLHLVSLDIPFPPNYGGAIDVFYKLKSLSALNCNIFLHCFYSDRKRHKKLNKYCKKVFYYPRNRSMINLVFSKNPFLIQSRQSSVLIKNLNKLDFPILFDGLQSTAVAFDSRLKKRAKYVRIHNVESQYIKKLALAEPNWIKRVGLLLDAYKYKLFEKKISVFDYVFAISSKDRLFYYQYNQKIKTIHPFHGNRKILSLIGCGDFILHHGNYHVSENYVAALFLIKKVFLGESWKLIIAGSGAHKKFYSKIKNHAYITIVDSPDSDTMNLLIQKAHINILPSFQPTGMKLKLINSLYLGRHCLVSPEMVSPCPDLKRLCTVCYSEEDFKKQIISKMKIPFNKNMKTLRNKILTDLLDNKKSGAEIINTISQKDKND